jgi:uncharacterized coiled-coil DUF342 family protein
MQEALAYNDIIDSFYRKLVDLLRLHKSIVPVLKDELNSIISADTGALDECLRELQALTLQIRALEKESEEILRANGISTVNLSDLIRQLPAKEQTRFLSLKDQFAGCVREITFYKDKCAVMLKTKLFRLEKKQSGAAQNENTDSKELVDEATHPSKAFEVTV